MTLTIKTINDIDKLKLFAINNPRQPLCYVYYKNNLLYKNVYYNVFTTQNFYTIQQSLGLGYSDIKNYLLKYGNYSLDYPIAQDYEIILRSKKIKIKKIDKIISVMRDGGITNTNQLTSLKYFMKAQIKNKTNKIYLCIMIYIYGIFKVILKIILNKLKLINIL